MSAANPQPPTVYALPESISPRSRARATSCAARWRETPNLTPISAKVRRCNRRRATSSSLGCALAMLISDMWGIKSLYATP